MKNMSFLLHPSCIFVFDACLFAHLLKEKKWYITTYEQTCRRMRLFINRVKCWLIIDRYIIKGETVDKPCWTRHKRTISAVHLSGTSFSVCWNVESKLRPDLNFRVRQEVREVSETNIIQLSCSAHCCVWVG